MTTELIPLVGTIVAGVAGIVVLAGVAWKTGGVAGVRRVAPLMVAVAMGGMLITAASVDVLASALLAASLSAIFCFVFAFYLRIANAPHAVGLTAVHWGVLGVVLVALALGVLVLGLTQSA